MKFCILQHIKSESAIDEIELGIHLSEIPVKVSF